MKKLIIILGGIVVIGGLVAAGYNLGNNSNSENSERLTKNNSQEKTEKLETSEDKDESFFGSMQDLIARGKSLKCTYKQSASANNDEYEIVMYISGGNVRTEAEMETNEGKTMESNMVINKDWMYMWNSFTPNGMKVDMQKMPDMNNVSEDDINKDMAIMAKNMDYKCRSWISDNSKFKIPTDIQFQDMTEIMAGMAGMTKDDLKGMEEESNKWICEHCKNAPTPELRAECLGDVVCE